MTGLSHKINSTCPIVTSTLHYITFSTNGPLGFYRGLSIWLTAIIWLDLLIFVSLSLTWISAHFQLYGLWGNQPIHLDFSRGSDHKTDYNSMVRFVIFLLLEPLRIFLCIFNPKAYGVTKWPIGVFCWGSDPMMDLSNLVRFFIF